MNGLIVAIDAEFGIGKNSQIPWHYMEDMKHFARTTKGSTCIMGRITAEDIAAMHESDTLLPNRESIVITSNPDFKLRDCLVAASVEEAIKMATRDNVFVIGGASIYHDSLPYVDEAHITFIPNTHECDVKIPEVIRYVIDNFDCVEETTSATTGLIYTKAKRKVKKK